MDPADLARLAAMFGVAGGSSTLAALTQQVQVAMQAHAASQVSATTPASAAAQAHTTAQAQALATRQRLQAALATAATTGKQPQTKDADEVNIEVVDEEDEEEDIYAAYVPSKVKEGVVHPNAIVETSSLAAVQPPDPVYTHHLQDIVAQGRISGAQLETVIYANMRFNMPKKHYVCHTAVVPHSEVPSEGVTVNEHFRPGFYLADGAGVGKGRQIAGLIAEHWRTGGRRALWLSEDAKRDVNALGLRHSIKIYPDGKTKQLPQGKLESKGVTDGVVFMTYSLLISGASVKIDKEEKERKGKKKKEKTLDYSYVKSQIMSNTKSRCKQIVKWLQGAESENEASPLIVLDECHKAKNLLSANGDPTLTGMAVVALQDALPNAKVVYSSATGASEPYNLAYMTRLGYWGFDNMGQFLSTIDIMGLGAMEMLAMSLKSMGIYVSRTLSYAGATFQLSELDLADEQKMMYNHAAEFWQFLFRVFFPKKYEARGYKSAGKALKGNFWAAHMRFFRQMLIAAKVPELCRRVNRAIADNKCCVIGLQSTGEAAAKSLDLSDGDELEDFLSAPKMVIVNLVRNFLPFALARMNEEDQQNMFVHVKERVDAWKAAYKQSASSLPDETPAQLAHRTRTTLAMESGAQAPNADAPQEASTSTPQAPSRSLADRIAAAKRTGMYCDLTAHVQQADYQAAMASAKQEEEEEERLQKDAASQKRAQAEALLAIPDSDDEGLDELDMSLASTLTKVLPSTLRKPLMDRDPNVQPGQAAKRSIATEALPSKRIRLSGDLDAINMDQPETSEKDDDTPCEECGNVKDVLGNQMLLCDGCDKGYHQNCLKPCLDIIPPGDWFCAACTDDPGQRTRVSQDSSTSEDVDSDFEVELEEIEEGSDRAIENTPAQTKDDNIYDIDLVSDSDEELEASGLTNKRVTRQERKKTVVALEIFEIDDLGDGMAAQLTASNPQIAAICKQLLQVADMLHLPPNPLDHITAECGGPDNVAEMTGRKMHLVKGEDGTMTYKRRVEEVSQHQINLTEMASFMDGQKLVAIISDAASTGISLHADRNRRNKRQRVHFTLELPWSADKAIQQFGRSHRSNQVLPPIYDLLITRCGGERRFASCAARRLMSLGALTKGDRRAMGAGGDLKDFQIDDKIGRLALGRILDEFLGDRSGPAPGVDHPKLPQDLEDLYTQGQLQMSLVLPPKLVADHPGTAAFYTHMQECCVSVGLIEQNEEETPSHHFTTDPSSIGTPYQRKLKGLGMDRFLNRLLGLKIEEQACLFEYFEATYKAMRNVAKLNGEISDAMTTLRGFTTLQKVSSQLLHTDPATGATTQIAKLRGDKRIKWQEAQDFLRENKDGAVEGSTGENYAGFYEFKGTAWQNNATVGGRKYPHVALVLYKREASYIERSKGRMEYKLIKPFGWTGKKHYYDLLAQYKPVSQERAQYLWDFWYYRTQRDCIHGDGCTRGPEDTPCKLGVREDLYIVEGALLPIWKTLMHHRTRLLLLDDSGAQRNCAQAGGKRKETKQFQVVKATLCKTSDRDDAPPQPETSSQPDTVVGLSLNKEQAKYLTKAVEADSKGPEMAGGVAFEPTFG